MQGTDYLCLLQQLPFLIANSRNTFLPEDQLNCSYCIQMFSLVPFCDARVRNVHFLYHLSDYVSLYGSTMNFETSQSEMAHKLYAKQSFRRTNKNGDFLSSMMERNLLPMAVTQLVPLAFLESDNVEL